jgi:hypothetical protein
MPLIAACHPPAHRSPGGERPAAGPFRRLGYAVHDSVAALFGTPLAVLYYLVPGYNQLHSAFRWVCIHALETVLAGFGLDLLLRSERAPVRRIVRVWVEPPRWRCGSPRHCAISLFIPSPFGQSGRL